MPAEYATAAQVSYPQVPQVSRSRADQASWLARTAVLLLGLGQAWITRYQSNPDGIAYTDIAKAWLRGDWANALSTYWSPLYSWLLAVAFAIVKPDAGNTLPLAHAVNFAGFAASLYGWELLYDEWWKWQGPPAHSGTVRFAGYATLLWCDLHLAGLGTESADIFVAAILLCLSALLVRVRRNAARLSDYALIGALLGLSFLAKAACLALLPVCLAVVALLFRSIRDRRLWIMAAAAVLTVAPFVVALSTSRHRFVISDTGYLNYSMVVGGFSVEGYKDSITPLPPNLPHPFWVRSDNPRVLSFESHVTGTYPAHNDPAWWLAGLPLRVNRALQWRAIEAGTQYSLALFAGCPALALLVLGVDRLGPRGFLASVRRGWFLIVPSSALLAGYIAIVVHPRYVAGSLAVFGFLALASMWSVPLSPLRVRLVKAATIAVISWVMWIDLASIPFYTFGGLIDPNNTPGNSGVAIAETLARAGVQPGDRAGYIGDGVSAVWAELTGTQIVAIVPPRTFHDERTIARNFEMTFDQCDRFWAAGPEARNRVLAAMRAAGAKWVFADNLPKGVVAQGWSIAGTRRPWSGTRSDFVYYRYLDDTVLGSR